MNKQDKILEEQLSEVEIGNLPEKEFRIIIVKMMQNLWKRMEVRTEKIQEIFNRVRRFKEQSDGDEWYNNWNEKYTRRNQRQNKWGKERINELEDRMVEITAVEQNTEKRMKRNEDSLRDLWDNIKDTNSWIIGVPEEKEKESEKIFKEITVENFPNMGKEIAT